MYQFSKHKCPWCAGKKSSAFKYFRKSLDKQLPMILQFGLIFLKEKCKCGVKIKNELSPKQYKNNTLIYLVLHKES